MMDPRTRTTNALLVFGTGHRFPITNTVNGSSLTGAAQVRWGIGGMCLDMANSSFNPATAGGLTQARLNFRNQWRWRNAPIRALVPAERTAIGYVGGNVSTTNYIIAIFDSCEAFDVHNFMRDRGVNRFALNLDGGGSTQARRNGSVIFPSTRTVPTMIEITG